MIYGNTVSFGNGNGTVDSAVLAPAFSSSTAYSAGDYVTRNDVLYRFTADHAAGAWTGTDAELVTVGEELESLDTGKANTDGSYEQMTVGNAEQLVSAVMVEDRAPYSFRTSGGSADIGNREYDTLAGGTLAWNQLSTVPSTQTVNNVTFTNNGDGSCTVDGLASAQTRVMVTQKIGIKGHKILMFGSPKNGSSSTYCMVDNQQSSNQYETGVGRIYPVTGSRVEVYIQISSGHDADSLEFVPQVFDLTLMFGTTIADYIYSLETANAGAGVAWFRKLFPAPYYAYQPGTLESGRASAHKTVGFNQWDEQWEGGSINNVSGQNMSSSERFRSKNYIPILPNTQYYCYRSGTANKRVYALYYDTSKAYLGYAFCKYITNTTFTTPADAAYMRFIVDNETTKTVDICINLSWSGSRNGEYEPYVEHTYPLDDTLTLRGIPKLDGDNNLYFDGDTYEADGTVTRRYGIVDLGTLSWDAGTGVFYADISDIAPYPMLYNMICEKYPVVARNSLSDNDKAMAKGINNQTANKRIFVHDSAYSDKDTFSAAMSGVYLVYELAAPTTEQADPFQSPQIVDDWGTEEYADADYAAENRDFAFPQGHSTKYPANLRDKLQHLPDLADDGDGDYIIRQTGANMALVPLPAAFPATPAEDGTYTLKVTVSSGTATLAWVSDT